MNKVFVVIMNLAVMGMYASQPHLDEITNAIQKSDLSEAKRQWELLDRTIKSADEKKKVLEHLKNVTTSVNRKQSSRKIVGGSLAWLGAHVAYQHGVNTAWYVRNIGHRSHTHSYLMDCAHGLVIISLVFIKDGIAGLIYGKGSPKSARVRDYFEELARKQ